MIFFVKYQNKINKGVFKMKNLINDLKVLRQDLSINQLICETNLEYERATMLAEFHKVIDDLISKYS